MNKTIRASIFVFISSFASVARADISYSVLDIGTLGGTFSRGSGINNAGHLVGQSTISGDNAVHAFLFSGGSMTDLGTLGGNDSGAYGVNDFGQVTGESFTAGIGPSHAFLYSGGSMTDAGSLGGPYTRGYSINNSGQIAGEAAVSNSIAHAFSNSAGTIADLGTLGGDNSHAYGVNAAGQVVGDSQTSRSSPNRVRAFLYSGGSMSDLGTLGGMTSGATAINNAGEITGWSSTNNSTHAFLYSSGSMTDLGSLGGTSEGYGINNFGQVTGVSRNGAGQLHAFLYSDSTIYDLNNLIAFAQGVTEISQTPGGNHINDWGQIAAEGIVNGNLHALLLTPTTPFSATTSNSRTTKLPGGMNFNKVPSFTFDIGFPYEWKLIDGVADVNRDVRMTISDTNTANMVSPIMTLSMASASLSNPPLTPFVLEASYNEADAIALFGSENNVRLVWLDPSDTAWKNSVLGNFGGSAFFAGDGAYDPSIDFHLGYYGVDTANNKVWAVINHNSDFAAGQPQIVPEPSTWAIFTLGILCLLLNPRRRTMRCSEPLRASRHLLPPPPFPPRSPSFPLVPKFYFGTRLSAKLSFLFSPICVATSR